MSESSGRREFACHFLTVGKIDHLADHSMQCYIDGINAAMQQQRSVRSGTHARTVRRRRCVKLGVIHRSVSRRACYGLSLPLGPRSLYQTVSVAVELRRSMVRTSTRTTFRPVRWCKSAISSPRWFGASH